MLVSGEFSTFVGRKYGFYSFILKGHLSIGKVAKVKVQECSRKVLDLLCNYEPLTLNAPSLIFYNYEPLTLNAPSLIFCNYEPPTFTFRNRAPYI
jgi:hypothetical protein